MLKLWRLQVLSPLDDWPDLETNLAKRPNNPHVKTQGQGSYQHGVGEAVLSKKPKVGQTKWLMIKWPSKLKHKPIVFVFRIIFIFIIIIIVVLCNIFICRFVFLDSPKEYNEYWKMKIGENQFKVRMQLQNSGCSGLVVLW